MRYQRIALALLLCGVGTSFAHTQENGRQNKPFGGIVVEASDGSPIPEVEVRLYSASPTGGALSPDFTTKTTDSQGRFAFSDTATKAYRLSVMRNGYVREDISLGNAQPAGDLVVRLVKTASVAGQVTTRDGKPIVACDVLLLRKTTSMTGKEDLSPVLKTNTDERGRFRLFFVTPGSYLLVATNTLLAAGSNLAASTPVLRAPTIDRFATTFYPGVEDISASQLMVVPPAAELLRSNIVVMIAAPRTVRGRVVDAGTGQPPPNPTLTLYSQVAGAALPINPSRTAHTYDKASGAFEFNGVVPGHYWLRVQAAIAASSFSLTSRTSSVSFVESIAVASSDVNNVEISLTAGSIVTGRVTLDGADYRTAPNIQRIRVQIELLPEGGGLSQLLTIPSSAVNNDGTFAIPNVLSNVPYRIHVAAGPTVAMDRARYHGVDVLAKSLIAEPGEADSLEIALRPVSSGLTGRVVDTAGNSLVNWRVLLLPELRQRFDLIREARSAPDGTFALRGTAPGRYRLIALEDSVDSSGIDDDLWNRVLRDGQSVDIGVGPLTSLAIVGKKVQ